MLDFQAARVLIEGDVPGQQGNHHPTAVPMGTFPAADGVFNLAPGHQRPLGGPCARCWATPSWADDERYARPGARAKRRDEVNAMIAEVTRTRPADHWIELFLAEGVPAGPVLDLGEMFAHPQIRHLEMAQPIDHPTRGRVRRRRPAPHLRRRPARPGRAPRGAGPGRAHRRHPRASWASTPTEIAALRRAHVV